MHNFDVLMGHAGEYILTRPKLQNSVYLHLKSAINGALPLEYAIRFVRLSNAGIEEKWSGLAQEIRAYWLGFGITEAEIDGEDLMDFAWDTIQVGYPLSRIHGRFYPNQEFLNSVNEGLAGVRSLFEEKLDPLRIPITRYFRICDLLRGNDIPRLLNASAENIQRAQKYTAKESILLSEFIKKVREPIALHAGFQFVSQYVERSGRVTENFGFTLDTEIDISIPELKRLVREFLYQYAVRRMNFNPTPELLQLSQDLINDFLLEDLHGKEMDHNAPRLNSFVTKLSGIHCWDRFHFHKTQGTRSALDLAIADTLAIYPKQAIAVGEDAIRKNYNEARKKIQGLNFK